MDEHAHESTVGGSASWPQNALMDDRALRIGVLLAAHIIFLSAAALRIIRGQRRHLLRSRAAWWLQYYPPLVWLPFVVAYVLPLTIELAYGLQLAGVLLEGFGDAYGAFVRRVPTLVPFAR